MKTREMRCVSTVLISCVLGLYSSHLMAASGNTRSIDHVWEVKLSRSAKENKDTTFYYTLQPVPRKDRTDIVVTLSFTANSDTAIAITLPRDFYGTPNLYKYITGIEGANGTVVETTSSVAARKVKPNAKGEVLLKYTVSYDPAALAGYSYAPNISGKFFHVASCQWMLGVGDIFNTAHEYDVKVVSPPAGWHLYTSKSADATHTVFQGSFYDVFNLYWGGGSQPYRSYDYKGGKLYVFVSDQIRVSADRIFGYVYDIVKTQRDLFQDYDFPFYTVTVLPREGNVAGLRVKNMFMAYLDENVNAMQMSQLLAHEMTHEWLGASNKLNIQLSEEDKSYKFHWFTEGFSDYLAYKMITRAGVIPQDTFVTMMNRYIVNIADNRYRNYTYRQMIGLSDSGKYSTEPIKLQYYRGALIGLEADYQLRKQGKGTLENFIKQMYSAVRARREPMTEEWFFTYAKEHGLDFRKWHEDYIINGKSIPVHPNALGKGYVLLEKDIPSFEMGFDLRESYRNKKITNLNPGSNAEKAGLTEGMPFINVENDTRFGNAWRYDKPVVVVAKENGVEKRIPFWPQGPVMRVVQFKKAAGK